MAKLKLSTLIQQQNKVLGSSHKISKASIQTPNGETKEVFYKENKHGLALSSRYEAAFSCLARLFVGELISEHHLVENDQQSAVVGVAVEHIQYPIVAKEGIDADYFEHRGYNQPSKTPKVTFLNEKPHGFFKVLMDDPQLQIDYEALASTLCGPYALEEDDLHKGNFGFYIVDRRPVGGLKPVPTVVFFTIDHDLKFTDTVMSRHAIRPVHSFNDVKAFQITAFDLANFPYLRDSSNKYWPTRMTSFVNPFQGKSYLDANEVNAFINLGKNPKFIEAKWAHFLKQIQITDQQIVESLTNTLEVSDKNDRADSLLIAQAAIDRKAKLETVLLSMPEFMGYLKDKKVGKYSEYLQSDPHNAATWQAGDTPLHTAIRLGKYRFQDSMDFFDDFRDTPNEAGQKPLDVAFALLKSNNQPSSMQDDYRSIIKHLIQHGAQPNPDQMIQYQEFKDHRSAVEKDYTDQASQCTDYQQLKQVLARIPEERKAPDLKGQKLVAVQCVDAFIKANQNNPDLKIMLTSLKQEIAQRDPDLKYLVQLRSHLWIVRQIRGVYGKTSTQDDINNLVDKAVYPDINKQYKQESKQLSEVDEEAQHEQTKQKP